MVATAEKYQDIPDCGAGPRFAYSSWPVASHNEQRSSTNKHEDGQRVEAVVSLCRCGENIHYIPVVQSSESAYTFVPSRLRGENRLYSPVTAYSYYARGLCHQRNLPAGCQWAASVTTNCIYYDSQWQVLEVRTGGTAASNVTEQMVWSTAYVNAAVLQDSYYNGVLQANQRLYFLQDANWNTTAVVGYNSTTGTWQVTQRYVYSPYGTITVLNADWSTTPTGTTPLVNNLYQGMALDPVTGLYNERARWYSPSLGTWISQDPPHYINGENTYQFVGSSPVGNIDPQGLDPWGPLPPPGYTPPTINSVPQLLYGLMNMGVGIGQIALGFSAQAGDLTPAAPLTAISGTVTIVNGALQFNKGGFEFMNSIGANLSNPFPTNVTGSTVTVVAGKLGLSKSTANLLGTATNLVPIGEENSDGFANAVSAFQRTGDWLDFARASLAWIQGHLFLAGPHCKNTLIDGPDKPKSWFESQGDKLA